MEKVSYKVILLTIAVFAVGMWSVPGLTLSAPNWEINYQGKLTDNTGALVANGNYDMEFKLYTVPTGGSAIWTETLTGANQVPVTNGLFSVMLGSTTALTGVNFNQTLYLGVNIATDGEMTPRKVLGAVPAAFEAGNAATLGGVASTSFLRSDEADSASGLLTFTGGLISNSSSTITELTFLTATGTTLVLGGDTITDITGSGLALSGGALTANISESNLNIAGGPTNGYVLQASSTATGGFVWTATSTLGINGHDEVTLAGAYDYLTLSGQEITLGQIDLSTDVTGTLSASNIQDAYLRNDGDTGTGDYTITGTLGVTGTTTLATSGGRVGIGTIAPYSKLHTIVGAALSTSALFSTSDWNFGVAGSGLSIRPGAATGNTYSELQSWNTGAGAYGNLALNPGGGNVGIGTTAPAYKFEVDGTSRFDDIMRFGADGEGWITWDSSAANTFNITGQSGKALSLGSNAVADRLYLSTAGNVGIGTTSPGAPLNINANNVTTYGQVAIQDTGSGDSAISFLSFADEDGTRRAYFGDASGSNDDIYLHADTGMLRFGSGGTADRMVINESGNVGIGTASPGMLLTLEDDNINVGLADTSGQLSIRGETDTNKRLNLGYQTTDNYGWLQSGINGTGFGTLALNPGGGNVGIGTTSPESLLHVYAGASGVGPNAVADDFVIESASDTGLSILSPSDERGIILFGSPASAFRARIQYDHAVDEMLFTTVGTTRLLIDSSGNVGIGTTSPGAKLHVYGTTNGTQQVIESTGTSGYIRFDESGTARGYLGYGDASSLFTDASTDSLSLRSQGDLHLGSGIGADVTVDTTGNVGIGTTSPGAKLSVDNTNSYALIGNIQNKFVSEGTSAVSDFLIVDADNSNSRAALQVQGNGGATEVLFVSSGGNVGIGDTSPASLFTVGNGDLFQVNSSGDIITQSVGVDALESEDFGDFTCNGTTCSLDATYLTSVDISDNTNLSVTATGLELSGDAIALAADYTIPLTASTTEWATFYTTPSTRITAGTGISWSGNTLNLDNDFGASIDESELNIVAAPTDGYVLQASSTSAGGFVWVATSTLGIDGGGGGLTSDDIDTSAELAAILTDETGTAGSVVFSADPTFTGTAIFGNTGVQVGSSVPFSDSSGTLTLQNIDALDATTESTVEAAIDTLANLTSASSLSTIGTITTGTWQGTAVTDTYIADTLTLETISGTPVITNGVRIGTDDTDHLIDEASNGAGSATLYIGNESILASGDIGASVQAYDADLDTYAGITPSANVQSLLGAADYAAMRTQLDLEAGTDFYSISAADAAFEGELNNEAGLYAALSDVTQFWEAGDTINSGTLALDSLSYTGTLDDTNVNDTLTIGAGGSVADGALSANVSLLGSTINANELASEDFGDFTCNGTTCSLDATYLTSVDISDNTNLSVTATGLELSGDAIALAADYTIPLTASTTEWATFYTTPSTRITAGTGISWSGNTLNLDNDFGASIDESELNIVAAPTDGYVLQASSTSAGGFVWVATSTLGLSSPFGPSINANELASEDFGDFTCNGTTCTVDINAIALGTDTTGNYLATLADDGGGMLTITGSGSESAAATIGIVNGSITGTKIANGTISGSKIQNSTITTTKLDIADGLDFTEFADALSLDASTDIAIDGSEVFSLTNTGTGNSFVVNDEGSDTSPFVIDASGNVGVGDTSPSALLNVGAGNASTVDGTNDLFVTDDIEVDGDGFIAGALDIIGNITSAGWAGDVITAAYIADDIAVGSGGSIDSTALYDGGTISFDWVDAEIADTLTIGSGSTIANDLITPDDVLSAGQTDEYCLTYEQTGDTWAWQTCGSNYWTQSGSDLYYTTGNVSIGTPSANGRLQVVGDEVRIGDAGTVNVATGDGDLYVEDTLEVDGGLRLGGTSFVDSANFTFADSVVSISDSSFTFSGTDANITLGSNYLSGDGGDEGVYVDASGNVGVGVGGTIDKRLEVFETVADDQFRISYDASRYTDFQVNSVGDLIIDAQGGDVRLNDENLWVCSGGSCPTGSPAGTGNAIVENSLGVGTSSPREAVEIWDNLYVANGDATTAGTATSTFQGDVLILGKLDVGTIDPVYRIDETNYATYGLSSIGVKEEIGETLLVNTYNESTGYYERHITWNELEEASDLWLFYQITDFGALWEKLTVSLTAGFDGRVFYTKDVKQNALVIQATQPGEVSVTFAAHRFDWRKWGNVRKDQDGTAHFELESKK